MCNCLICVQKKFVKGLRQHGKNFFKIRAELLPEKQTVSKIIYILCIIKVLKHKELVRKK